MEKMEYNDRISSISEIRALGNKLSVEEALKFISTDTKIAPNCVELILTTLGYINRVHDRICYTERLLVLTNYDTDTHINKLTADGLELLDRLVFNSVYRIKPQRIIHPVIFDRYTQPLAALDDKTLIQIDNALSSIYDNLRQKYNITNIDSDTYHRMLEDAEMFKFDADGNVERYIADMCHYNYYIYNAENIDKDNVVNGLSINSVEMYISKETYIKLLQKIDEIFKNRIKDGVFKIADDGDRIKEDRSSDKDITLSRFVSMVAENCENKCTEADVYIAMAMAGFIEIGKGDHIFINEPRTNVYLYEDQYGHIFVRTEKMLKLFFVLASTSTKLFNAMCDIDMDNTMHINPYFGMNGYGYNCMAFPMSPMSPISPITPMGPVSPMGPMSPISPMQNMMAKPTPSSVTINNTTKSKTTIKRGK